MKSKQLSLNILSKNLINVKFANMTKSENYLPDIIPIKNDYSYYFQSFTDIILTKPIDTSKCYYLIRTFANCKNLVSIKYLDKIDTSNVLSMQSIFGNDKNLVDYSGIENWNVSNCICFNQAFENSGITSLKYFENWNFNNASCVEMFKNSELLSLEGLNKIDFSNVISTNKMFSQLKITSLKGSENLDISNVKDCSNMFAYNKNLKDFTGSETWKLPVGMTISNVLNSFDYNCIY